MVVVRLSERDSHTSAALNPVTNTCKFINSLLMVCLLFLYGLFGSQEWLELNEEGGAPCLFPPFTLSL